MVAPEVSENAELSRLVDEAGPGAGAGATVETGRLDRSLEMGQSLAPPPSATTALWGSENTLAEIVALPDGHVVVPYPGVPEWAVALFTGADEAQEECLVAVAREEIVRHAMYARSEDGRPADIGILVEDEWQRRGIGKLLLSRLAVEAERHGIETFTSVVLGENWPMFEEHYNRASQQA